MLQIHNHLVQRILEDPLISLSTIKDDDHLAAYKTPKFLKNSKNLQLIHRQGEQYVYFVFILLFRFLQSLFFLKHVRFDIVTVKIFPFYFFSLLVSHKKLKTKWILLLDCKKCVACKVCIIFYWLEICDQLQWVVVIIRSSYGCPWSSAHLAQKIICLYSQHLCLDIYISTKKQWAYSSNCRKCHMQWVKSVCVTDFALM